MKVSNRQIAKAIYKLMQENSTQKHIATSLAAYLIIQKRVKDYPAVLRELEKQIYLESSVADINIRSRYQVPEALKSRVAKLLKIENPSFIEQTDNSLLGGAVFSALDKEIDLSLNRQLNQLINSGVK